MLHAIFQDKRLISILFLAWGFLVACMFAMTGVFNSPFVRFGPGVNLKFMAIPIDTWGRWWLVALFGALDSAVWELSHEAIYPWVMNSVLDPKATTLPYDRWTCLAVIEAYHLHGIVLGPFAFWISLTQFDLVLIKSFASMGMRVYSHYQYIKHKPSEARPPPFDSYAEIIS